MKFLFILLFHPTHIISGRGRVSPVLLHLSVIGYAMLCGASFQHIYPRVLNTVPWLGVFRKLDPGNWNPRFDQELFLRGAAMALLLFVSHAVSFWLFALFGKGRGSALRLGYTAALATCIPFLITAAVGFFFYHLQSSLGLIPVYGLFASACLQAILLKDLFSVHRAFIVYFVPATLCLQLYGCYLILP